MVCAVVHFDCLALVACSQVMPMLCARHGANLIYDSLVEVVDHCLPFVSVSNERADEPDSQILQFTILQHTDKTRKNELVSVGC